MALKGSGDSKGIIIKGARIGTRGTADNYVFTDWQSLDSPQKGI